MIVLPCRGLHLPIDDPGDCNDTIAWPFMIRKISMIVLPCKFYISLLLIRGIVMILLLGLLMAREIAMIAFP